VAETVDLIAMAHHVAGEQRAAASYYERSVALFTQMEDRRGLANALGLLALCGPSYQSSSTTPYVGELVREELVAPRSMRLAREIGWRAGETFLRFIIADCLVAYGEYDRAMPLAQEALAQAEEIEHLQWTAGSLRLLGALALDLLAPNVAREHLEAAHRIAQRLGSRVWIRWTAAPLAIARARTSQLPEAIEVLDRAARLSGDGESRERTAGPGAVDATLGERHLWAARAEIALVEQRPETALHIIDARIGAERAANPDATVGVPRLTLMRAEALTMLSRYGEAEGTLEQARDETTALGMRPLLWRVEAAVGHLHRLQRRRLEARRAFDAARGIAEDLAAKVPDESLRTQFREGLDGLLPSSAPVSAGRAAKEAFGGLTQREREVVELIAQGKPNRSIARDLGIGERTVEGYVASALGKLGFSSRTQLAAWAVERGMTRPPAPASRSSR